MQMYIQNFRSYLDVQKGYSSKTVEAYSYDLIRFTSFLKCIHITKPELVTKNCIRNYLTDLSIDSGTHKSCSVVTRARILSSIRSFFAYLLEEEVIIKNPAASIPIPQLPELEPVYLTYDESCELIRTVKLTATPFFYARDLAIIHLLLSSGIRVSELTTLQIKDFLLSNLSIKIKRKGNKEQTIPINIESANLISNYLDIRPISTSTLLFLSKNREGLRTNSVYYIVKKYFRRAGIVKAKSGPHVLRHTCFTLMLRENVNPVVIQTLAGHSSFDTTRRYLHLNDNQLKDAVSKITFKGDI